MDNTNGLAAGIELADIGIQKVSRKYSAWLIKARKAAIEHAQAYGSVTSDDVHEMHPLPEGAHPNLMGAVFRGIPLYLGGYTHSRRPSARGRIIRVYKAK